MGREGPGSDLRIPAKPRHMGEKSIDSVLDEAPAPPTRSGRTDRWFYSRSASLVTKAGRRLWIITEGGLSRATSALRIRSTRRTRRSLRPHSTHINQDRNFDGWRHKCAGRLSFLV